MESPRFWESPPPRRRSVAAFNVTTPLIASVAANVETTMGAIGAKKVESPRCTVIEMMPAMDRPPPSTMITRSVPSERVP
jgi:hypothetical protein